MDPNPEPSTADEEPAAYPWETSTVLPEDKALGLELELIELEHERGEAELEGGPTGPIEAEITEVLHDLEDTAEHVAAPGAEPHVDIHAPEAADLGELPE